MITAVLILIVALVAAGYLRLSRKVDEAEAVVRYPLSHVRIIDRDEEGA